MYSVTHFLLPFLIYLSVCLPAVALDGANNMLQNKMNKSKPDQFFLR